MKGQQDSLKMCDFGMWMQRERHWTAEYLCIIQDLESGI